MCFTTVRVETLTHDSSLDDDDKDVDFGGIIVYSLGSFPKEEANYNVRPGSILLLSSSLILKR